MAEICDSSPPPLPNLLNFEMRKTKPGLKRLILTLTVFFSFLSALPWLLKSIEIYRSPLPFQDISNAVDSNPVVFPCQFHLLFVNKDHASSFLPDENLGFLIASYMSEYAGNTSCGTCDGNYSVSVASDAAEVSALTEFNFDQADELVDDYLLSVVGRGRVYTIVVVNGGDRDGVRAVVGKYRHGWVIGRVAEPEMLAEMFVKVFASGAKEEPSIQGEFMPVGADGKIVLSFNLLNADPRDWIYDWDFKEVGEKLLAPTLEALGPIANISVESQVLYHTPKSSYSYWDDEHESHIFSTKDLPFFICTICQ